MVQNTRIINDGIILLIDVLKNSLRSECPFIFFLFGGRRQRREGPRRRPSRVEEAGEVLRGAGLLQHPSRGLRICSMSAGSLADASALSKLNSWRLPKLIKIK